MRSQGAKMSLPGRFGPLAAACLVAGSLALMPDAGAQDASPPPPAQAPAPPAERPPNPGLFEAIGRWFDRGTTTFRDHLRGAKERMDDLSDRAAANSRNMGDRAAEVGKGAADVTKDAVDAMVKLPGTRVMSGRERCVVAPNGAPDCTVAAEALCRKHGYSSGKTIDLTSAEECPPRAWLSGRPAEAECRTVTFINRAMCQ